MAALMPEDTPTETAKLAPTVKETLEVRPTVLEADASLEASLERDSFLKGKPLFVTDILALSIRKLNSSLRLAVRLYALQPVRLFKSVESIPEQSLVLIQLPSAEITIPLALTLAAQKAIALEELASAELGSRALTAQLLHKFQ